MPSVTIRSKIRDIIFPEVKFSRRRRAAFYTAKDRALSFGKLFCDLPAFRFRPFLSGEGGGRRRGVHSRFRRRCRVTRPVIFRCDAQEKSRQNKEERCGFLRR